MNACPYCQNTSNNKSYLEDTIFNNKTFSYIECQECRVIFTNPFPDKNDYEVMYPVEYQGEIFRDTKKKYFSLFERIKSIRPQTKTILDYGCGNAELICDARSFGFTPTGVEYSPHFVEKLRENNPDIDFFTLVDFLEKDTVKYNVIILNNVLEHLINPNEILQKLKDKLQENGLLVCLGPIENNFTIALLFRKLIFSIRKKIVHKKASHIPYHITFTNVKNQKMIFAQNGFSELYFETKETAWPFPEKIDFKSMKNILFGSIAKISKLTSKIFSKNSGNTFVYIGSVKN